MRIKYFCDNIYSGARAGQNDQTNFNFMTEIDLGIDLLKRS